MVKPNAQGAVYDLEQVKALAERRCAAWRGWRTQQRCQQTLGLSFDQACEEITYLEPQDFHKTYTNEDGSVDDAYRIEITDGFGRSRVPAFIKLSIEEDELRLDIGSFHHEDFYNG